MFRLIGALLLLAGTSGYSRCYCMELRDRYACLLELRRMYELLASQIDYGRAAFPEACKMTAGKVKAPFDRFLAEIDREAELGGGRPLPQVWEEQAGRLLSDCPLRRTDGRLLTEFARNFGYADGELQKRAFERALAELDAELQSTRGHMAEREKLVMSFGILGGLFGVVCLL